MSNDNKLIIVDESTLKDKIYTIRGQQVMLDFDLAEIYGYETRYLNLQVKHNINRKRLIIRCLLLTAGR